MKKLGFIIPLFLAVPFLAQASCGVVPQGSISTSTILASTNIDRCGVGQKPLRYDTQLAKAAQEKASDMASRGYFAHLNPDGVMVWPTITKDGYPYYYAGENLAYQFTDNELMNTAFMQSPTHKANIVAHKYQDIGVGVAQGPYGLYVVVLFGSK